MVSSQKRLAAEILKVGKDRVWLDPSKMSEIEKAITKADIRRLILKGMIKKLPKKIENPMKKRGGKRVKKGKKYAKISRKKRWIMIVRALRSTLAELKSSNKIDNITYRKLYKLVKGGMFRSKAHLMVYIEQHGLLKKGER